MWPQGKSESHRSEKDNKARVFGVLLTPFRLPNLPHLFSAECVLYNTRKRWLFSKLWLFSQLSNSAFRLKIDQSFFAEVTDISEKWLRLCTK